MDRWFQLVARRTGFIRKSAVFVVARGNGKAKSPTKTVRDRRISPQAAHAAPNLGQSKCSCFSQTTKNRLYGSSERVDRAGIRERELRQTIINTYIQRGQRYNIDFIDDALVPEAYCYAYY